MAINIKPSKRGTFTAAAKKRGKSVQGFASQVLANKGNYSSAMVKKANFARNAAKWKKPLGGEIEGLSNLLPMLDFAVPGVGTGAKALADIILPLIGGKPSATIDKASSPMMGKMQHGGAIGNPDPDPDPKKSKANFYKRLREKNILPADMTQEYFSNKLPADSLAMYTKRYTDTIGALHPSDPKANKENMKLVSVTNYEADIKKATPADTLDFDTAFRKALADGQPILEFEGKKYKVALDPNAPKTSGRKAIVPGSKEEKTVSMQQLAASKNKKAYGGRLKQHNAPTHTFGGQTVDMNGNPSNSNAVAEIEGNENILVDPTGKNQPYVFSDRLGTAQEAARINRTMKGDNQIARNGRRLAFEALRAKNEKLKSMAMGGSYGKYQNGGPVTDPEVIPNPYRQSIQKGIYDSVMGMKPNMPASVLPDIDSINLPSFRTEPYEFINQMEENISMFRKPSLRGTSWDNNSVPYSGRKVYEPLTGIKAGNVKRKYNNTGEEALKNMSKPVIDQFGIVDTADDILYPKTQPSVDRSKSRAGASKNIQYPSMDKLGVIDTVDDINAPKAEPFITSVTDRKGNNKLSATRPEDLIPGIRKVPVGPPPVSSAKKTTVNKAKIPIKPTIAAPATTDSASGLPESPNSFWEAQQSGLPFGTPASPLIPSLNMRGGIGKTNRNFQPLPTKNFIPDNIKSTSKPIPFNRLLTDDKIGTGTEPTTEEAQVQNLEGGKKDFQSKLGSILKGIAYAGSGIDAFMPYEREKERQADFTKGDRLFSQTGASYQSLANEAIGQSNVARQTAATGSRNIGQFMNRQRAISSSTGRNLANISLQQKQYNDQLRMTRGQREDSKALSRQADQIRTQTATSQNRAKRQDLIANFLGNVNNLGTELQRQSYLKETTRDMNAAQKRQFLLDISTINVQNPNFQIADPKQFKAALDSNDLDKAMGLIKFVK